MIILKLFHHKISFVLATATLFIDGIILMLPIANIDKIELNHNIFSNRKNNKTIEIIITTTNISISFRSSDVMLSKYFDFTYLNFIK